MSPKFILVHCERAEIYLNISQIVSFYRTSAFSPEAGTTITLSNSENNCYIDETIKELKELINLSLC